MTAPTPITSADNAPRPFRTFGDQLQAVMRAESDSLPDGRLLQVRAAAGGSEAVPSDGGFLVQPQFSRQIIQRMYNTGEIYRRCLESPTTSSSLMFPQFDEKARTALSRLGGVQVFNLPEAGSLTSLSTHPSFQLTELKTDRIAGLLYVSDELADDSSALGTWAEYALSQEVLFTLENQIVTGTGAGQPLGMMNSPALITVAEEPGQAAASVVSQNVINMLSRLWAPSRKNAVWLYHQDLLPWLIQLKIVVGVAGAESSLWHFAEGDEDGIDRLGGIPAFPSEYCQVPGTPGDLILADFSRYVIAMREKERLDVSIHLKFLTMERAFRFTMRVGGGTIDRTPILPLHGSSTTSPFICLAARA